MIMDCEKYVGKCVCGRDHELETKKVIVEYGAINNFEQYMADVGLAGKKRAVIYDTVIYKLTEGKHVAADQEIVLEANGLRAEDTAKSGIMTASSSPQRPSSISLSSLSATPALSTVCPKARPKDALLSLFREARQYTRRVLTFTILSPNSTARRSKTTISLQKRLQSAAPVRRSPARCTE